MSHFEISMYNVHVFCHPSFNCDKQMLVHVRREIFFLLFPQSKMVHLDVFPGRTCFHSIVRKLVEFSMGDCPLHRDLLICRAHLISLGTD